MVKQSWHSTRVVRHWTRQSWRTTQRAAYILMVLRIRMRSNRTLWASDSGKGDCVSLYLVAMLFAFAAEQVSPLASSESHTLRLSSSLSWNERLFETHSNEPFMQREPGRPHDPLMRFLPICSWPAWAQPPSNEWRPWLCERFQCTQVCVLHVVETVADASVPRIFLTRKPRLRVVQQWAVSPAIGRPNLLKEVRSLDQDVSRCHPYDLTVRFASSLVAIPWRTNQQPRLFFRPSNRFRRPHEASAARLRIEQLSAVSTLERVYGVDISHENCGHPNLAVVWFSDGFNKSTRFFF